MHIFTRYGTLSSQSPSRAHREPLRGVARGVLLGIGISLLFVPNAGSSESMLIKKKSYVSYRQYASIILDNPKEYKCLNYLYGKESAWNPLAKNGSHNGIPQGRSEYLARVDGYKQIQWGLNYIAHRYGEPCIALDHWRKHGWH